MTGSSAPGGAGEHGRCLGVDAEHVGEGALSDAPANAGPRRFLVGVGQGHADASDRIHQLGGPASDRAVAQLAGADAHVGLDELVEEVVARQASAGG